jgi:hypothetical protein
MDDRDYCDPQETQVIPFNAKRTQELLGFRPAFFDFATCSIYLSTDRQGSPVDFHTFEGLPDEVVTRRWLTGIVLAVKTTLLAGFERNGLFYTHRSAARAAAEWKA